MSETLRATVVGAGAWGTALAKVLVDKGHDVTLWSYEAEVASAINGASSSGFLPIGIQPSPSFRARLMAWRASPPT